MAGVTLCYVGLAFVLLALGLGGYVASQQTSGNEKDSESSQEQAPHPRTEQAPSQEAVIQEPAVMQESQGLSETSTSLSGKLAAPMDGGVETEVARSLDAGVTQIAVENNSEKRKGRRGGKKGRGKGGKGKKEDPGKETKSGLQSIGHELPP